MREESFTRKCYICKESKALDEFWIGQYECKVCRSEYQKRYRQGKGKVGINTRQRERYKANPEKARASRRQSTRKALYGLSSTNYELLKAQQEGKCAICKEIPKRLCVDHDHKTGKVRELLCSPCNTFLGRLENVENAEGLIQAALRYLQSTNN